MLAYVFWHWPNPDLRADDYEKLQRAFHTALAGVAPSGFIRSFVFRVEGAAPWLAPANSVGVPAYADWYALENAAALDALNEAAVTGLCERPHAEVAHAMAQGAGSLFSLRGEEPLLSSGRHATFLTKPRTTSYPDFYAQVSSLAPAPRSLWRRQLVLGPTPEFALLTSTPAQLPGDFQPIRLNLTRIDL